MKYGIGIDTGGTFTDSVIVDLESKQVVSKAKALTTRQDLRIGISNSISTLNSELFSEVRIVSLSTTLATNSVVEGKGQRVGLIMAVPNEMSFRLPDDLPAEETSVLCGAHDRAGKETIPLDIKTGRSIILKMKDRVDAFAVSGYFGVYNPEHEQQLKEIITRETGCPVVCGHELTEAIGMVERATTAVLNARLLPVIGDLLDAVDHILDEKSIDAPLMVVRGDGSLISEKAARSRPVETVLSGPAASVIGAGWLTDLNDALVVDMGGTTTDIGILTSDGPGISENGALIGEWQTRVRSVEMWTLGLGGDSKISINPDTVIRVGPRRVEPLSLASSRYEELNSKIEKLAGADELPMEITGLDFFTLVKMPQNSLDRHERKVLKALDGRILHRTEIEQLDTPWIDMDRFVNLGAVAEISLTPTDLLHVTGMLSIWDRRVVENAVSFYTKLTGLSSDKLIDSLLDEILHQLLLSISSRSLASDNISVLGNIDLLDSLLRLNGKGITSVDIRLKYPVVAVGAPVNAYFPGVAERLNATLIIPEHAEVANAVGAVTGCVIATAQVLVRPIRPLGFSVVPTEDDRIFDEIDTAMIYAEELARDTAQSSAKEMGAGKSGVTLRREEVTAPLGGGYGKNILMEYKITAIAVGEPYV